MNSSQPTACFLSLAAFCLLPVFSIAEVNKVEQVAPDVYFHEGDIKTSGHCNNGWIVFEDYVLVIDGNFPSGAQEIIPKIKALTDRSEEHTSELQSQSNLVCRLLLEKKKHTQRPLLL